MVEADLGIEFDFRECSGRSAMGIWTVSSQVAFDVIRGGQGEIRTRDFCLAKAAIYRADLLAHDESGNSPNAITHLKMMAGPGDGAVIRTALAPQPPPSRL